MAKKGWAFPWTKHDEEQLNRLQTLKSLHEDEANGTVTVLTVGKLKEILKDVPDHYEVQYNDESDGECNINAESCTIHATDGTVNFV